MKPKDVMNELEKYGRIWEVRFPYHSKSYVNVIYRKWEDAEHAYNKLEGKKLFGRHVRAEWIDKDRGHIVDEGRSDFGLIVERETNRSLIIRGIIEADQHDEIIMQRELVRLG